MDASGTQNQPESGSPTASEASGTANPIAGRIEADVEAEFRTQAAADQASLDAKIETWFSSSFQDSVVSRDTEVYNHVRAAVTALKKELAG
jgi:hypothetical protein